MSDKQHFTRQFVEKVDQYIFQNNLINPNQKILVGVSGGIDSMALLHYLILKKYPIEVAHVNFGLRKTDADLDTQLVKQCCEKNQIKFHLKSFETKKYAHKKGISIQMAARQLRYNWFEEILTNNRLQLIAVATHFDDHIETLLLNLFKGTGLKGLEGIKPKRNKIIRPLLNVSKNEIEIFAKEQNIVWRTDKSNFENYYERNFLRNQIIPKVQARFPSLKQSLQFISHICTENNLFIEHYLNNELQKLLKSSNNQQVIKISDVINHQLSAQLMWKVLEPVGFSSSQTQNILLYLKNKPKTGKTFYSTYFQLLINRNEIIISPISKPEIEIQILELPFKWIKKPTCIIEFELGKPVFDTKNLTSYVDAEKINLPLMLRNWQKGDKIRPLGLKNGHKKVSDLLIDKKTSLADKATQLVLVNGNNKIIWLPGLCVSEEFKISSKTKSIVKLSLLP